MSITTSDATATETNTTTGAFVVRRTGTPTGDLIVGYTVSGTAISASDFEALTGTVTIPEVLRPYMGGKALLVPKKK